MPARLPERPSEDTPLWLRALLECTPDTIYHIGCNGNLLHARTSGGASADVDGVGHHLRDHLPANVVELIQKAGAQARTKGHAVPVSYTQVVNGRQRRYEGHVTTVADDGIVHVARDVTASEHMHLEAPQGKYTSLFRPRFTSTAAPDGKEPRNTRSEEWLRCLDDAAQNAFDGISACDMDGIVIFANPAFARMHGYEPEEVLGKHISVFHTPEQMRPRSRELQRARRQMRHRPSARFRIGTNPAGHS